MKKIFFYRICGTGMGACAYLFKEAGHIVEGADLTFSPPMSDYLKSVGIPCYNLKDVDHAFLKKYDLIVVGNSVPKNSEHAKLIESSGIEYISFPSLLGDYLLKDRDVIGIAGTHGKTTTTYFLTQILEKMGHKCGYFVGGIINDRPPASLGTSPYFVIESDEYDSAYFQKFSKFRLYELDSMILTSLEYDHADIYKNVEEIEEQFRAVIPKLDTIVASADFSSIQKLAKEFQEKNWILYGDKSNLGPFNIIYESQKTTFELAGDTYQTNVVGEHNIWNIASCILWAKAKGFAVAEIKKAILDLDMVKRRQEFRGYYKEAVVIDDFAHHPRAISVTIESIKQKYPDKKLIVVFEPISATARSNIFQTEFVSAFKNAEEVLIAATSLATSAQNAKDLDIVQLIKDLNENGLPATAVTELGQLQQRLDGVADKNVLLLILSNRTCLGLWESDFVKNLY